MATPEKMQEYIKRRKERGEVYLSFYAESSFRDALNDYSKLIRRPRSYVIKAIIARYLERQGYDFGKAYSLDKPRKDIL